MHPDPSAVYDQDDEIIYRKNTVETLTRMMTDHCAIYVRGTPTSGKTTLAIQLQRYFLWRQKRAVIINGWPRIEDPVAYILSECLKAGYHITEIELPSSNIILIFDEAQQTCLDSELWMGLIKSRSGSLTGLRICLIASHGSPDSGSPDHAALTTPIRFGNEQRVSIVPSNLDHPPQIGLFYSKGEYLEALQKRCTIPTSVFDMDTDAKEYIFAVTRGHPGATHALWDYVYKVW